MIDSVKSAAGRSAYKGDISSAEAWFAGGERIGYDSNARAIVRAHGAPLNVFLRKEGDLAHAVSFLPGFPDGSFGWAKVQRHLPNELIARGEAEETLKHLRANFTCKRITPAEYWPLHNRAVTIVKRLNSLLA